MIPGKHREFIGEIYTYREFIGELYIGKNREKYSEIFRGNM